MDCTRAENLLSAYLDGDLPEREREGFAEHLRQCPLCAGEEKALRETLSLLRNLPVEKAPPGLLAGVRRRIGEETETVPFWKKLFLPLHIKIPLEAAAVALIFLLAYGIQKEMPPTNTPPSPPAKEMAATKAPPSSPAAVERGKAAPGTEMETGRRMAGVSPGLPADVPARKVEAKTADVGPREEAPFETEQASTPVPPPAKPPVLAQSEIPAGLASRVSTKGETIEPAISRESPAREAPEPLGVEEQLALLEKPSPYGKGVTIEVDPNDRAGMEDRITELAIRLGGGVRRIGRFTADKESGETTILREIIRVSVPAEAEVAFLEELGKMGTIPPAEGTSGKTDTSAGSSSGTVVYTVRIRIR